MSSPTVRLPLSFTKVDQDKNPVSGATFYLVDREGFITMVQGIIDGLKTVNPTFDSADLTPDKLLQDAQSLLSQLKSGNGPQMQVPYEDMLEMFVGAFKLSVDYKVDFKIPAVYKEVSDKNGLVRFDSDSNVWKLNFLNGSGKIDIKGLNFSQLLGVLGYNGGSDFLSTMIQGYNRTRASSISALTSEGSILALTCSL